MEDTTLDHSPQDRVAPATPFAPGTTVGHFRVVRELGAGGMGVVFEAHDPDLDRRVAIKVVRGCDAGSAAGLQLVREAQAMARLGHPNVVAIHEVGTIDSRVFLVMELVGGGTLARWLQTVRPWRDVVGAFLQAGAGLAAAHRAGLVHRDFKPSNVLMDDSGRALVGDFGLARDEDHARWALGSERASGTPGYMAPEQRAGEPVDARADQYAFAVSLQDALVARRVIGAPPRRVRAALARALAIDPWTRFAKMDELLAELSRALGARRRLAVAALVVIAGAGGAATAAWAVQTPVDECTRDARLVDAVWSPTLRAVTAVHFAAARPDATTTIATTTRVIDDWAAGWRLDRLAACHAEPSVRSARIACLDGDLGELRAQVAVWNRADAEAVDHAVSAAAALPAPSACDGRTSSEVLSEPARAVVERAAAIKAADRAGHAAQVRPELAALAAQAEASNSEQARATAHVSIAMVEYSMGEFASAHDRFAKAGVEAGHAGDDALMFAALRSEAIVATDLGRPLDTLGLVDAAEAVAARAKLDRTSQLATVRGNALVELGRFPESYRELQRAIGAVEARAAGDSAADFELGDALGLLASAHVQALEFTEARPLLERAIAIFERELGATHPEVGKLLGELAEAEVNLDDLTAATTHATRARAIFAAAYGQDHLLVGETEVTFARIAGAREHDDEALALFERARKNLATKLAPDHLAFATIETSAANIECNRGHYPEGLVHYERALAILEHRGAGGIAHATQLVTYAECLAQLPARTGDAYVAASKAVAELEQAGATPTQLAEAWVTLADLEAFNGHRARAIELARKMLEATAKLGGDAITAMRAHEQAQLATWSK